jgi:carbamoyltransferase
MLTCGIKLTHDGGVALLDDNRLLFSVEVEKLKGRVRHDGLRDLSSVDEILGPYGHSLSTVDRIVIDGWLGKVPMTVCDRSEHLSLAPYRRGVVSAELLEDYPGKILDLSYSSYPHYAGHAVSAYYSSPFARNGEDSYVICWDGPMFPFLYLVRHGEPAIESLGALHYLLGDSYHELSQLFPPFSAPVKWPHILSLAGKIMAYVAKGEAIPSLVSDIMVVYERAVREVFLDDPPADYALSEGNGRAILARLKDGFPDCTSYSPQDVLASIHDFIGDLFVSSVVKRIGEIGHGQRINLCLAGGCALNIKWNSRVRDSGVIDAMWIPPFPNDSGSAIGAACCDLMKHGQANHLDWSLYSGPGLNPSQPMSGWRSRECSIAGLAKKLHDENVPVMVLNGNSELGPRALGHRSILAPAVTGGMKDRLNHIKRRESYRPVAPICLEHRAREVFSPGSPDPFMLFEHAVREPWLDRVPAICHLDGTARLQTVGSSGDPAMLELLTEYESLSGIPLLCNTSANELNEGFFPDLRSAMEWGGVSAIWSEGVLYETIH